MSKSMGFSKEVTSKCGLRVSIFQDLISGSQTEGTAYVKDRGMRKRGRQVAVVVWFEAVWHK